MGFGVAHKPAQRAKLPLTGLFHTWFLRVFIFHLAANVAVFRRRYEQEALGCCKMGTQGWRLLLSAHPVGLQLMFTTFIPAGVIGNKNVWTQYLDTLHQFPEAEKHFFVCPAAETPHIPDNPPHSWPVVATCRYLDNGGLTSSLRCIEVLKDCEGMWKIHSYNQMLGDFAACGAVHFKQNWSHCACVSIYLLWYCTVSSLFSSLWAGSVDFAATGLAESDLIIITFSREIKSTALPYLRFL